MANQNFIPWLEGKDQYSAQQNQYNNIYKNGFESGNLVKAEDFNAALRMTTLVCAGIASVFGFDNKTIDASEDTIAKAIQAAKITLGDITADIIISKMGINTPSVTAAQVNASIINANTTITARGALSGMSLNINGTERIDSTGNIKNIASIDTAGSIRAAGVLEGNSLTINGVERINSDGNITGALVTVNEASMTHLGFTAGSNLVIDNYSNISANKIVSGTSIAANTININGTEMIDSSRNIKNVGTINTAGSITASGNVNGTNITASKVLKGNSLIVTGTPNIDNNGNIDVNSVKVNGSTRIDTAGNITGATVKSNGKLSGTFLNIGPLNGAVAAKVDINGNIQGENITASDYIAAPYFNMNTCPIAYSGLFDKSELRETITKPIGSYNPQTYQYLYYVEVAILYAGKTNYNTFSGWLPLHRLYNDKSFNGRLYMPVPDSSGNTTKYISIIIESNSPYNNSNTNYNMIIDFRQISSEVAPESEVTDKWHRGTRLVIYEVARYMKNPPIFG